MSKLTLIDHLDVTAALGMGFMTLWTGYALHVSLGITGLIALLKVIGYLSFVLKIER